MRTRNIWLGVVLVLALVAGCSSDDPTATPKIESTSTSSPATPAPAPVVLELEIEEDTQPLTMDDLKALPATEGWGGGKSSTGMITTPEMHKGVKLEELCESIGGLEPGTGVNVVAKDGYAMTFSYDQIVNGEFITYDPGTGDEMDIDDSLQVIVAYERSGERIPEDADGPLRLAIISEKNNQVVDGHWNVKWVTGIAIKSLAEDWTLGLEGALSEEMDRATFESCAATSCHQATWMDGEGRTWTGVPLWMMAARVDDDNRHGDDAYLDEDGYTLDVVAADGYSVSFQAARISRNNQILLAHLMDDEMLEEKHFPLRVVGEELEKSEMVSQIAQMVYHPPSESADASTTAEDTELAAPEWTLELEGALNETISGADFEKCVGCHAADWTSDSGKIWTDVPLWLIAGRADDETDHGTGAYSQSLAEDGYTLELVAADGYSVALDSARFNRADDIVLAYLADGEALEEKHFPLRLVGTGLEKGEQAGQIARILLNVPTQATEAPAGDVALTVTGAVDQALALSLVALDELEVVEASVEHPKKGVQTFTGVRLVDLLELAGVADDASRLTMTASDGYSNHTSMADIRACSDCLVALTDEGTLNMVMPGMEGGLWVKDVVTIEIE